MFNFGLAMFPVPKLVCYRVDPTGRLHHLGQLRLPAPMFNHDVALTAKHLLFVVPPLVFPPGKMLGAGLGLRNFIDAIEHDAARGTMIGLVPRDGGKPLVLHTDPTLHLHLANAYEDGADTVVDLINYQASWEQLNGTLSSVQTLLQTAYLPYGGNLVRMRITPSGRITREHLTALNGEFPTWNLSYTGRQNRYTYLSAGTDDSVHPNAIAKLDNTTGTQALYRLPDGQLPHEGVFAARSGATGEDDGWLLVASQDAVANVASLLVLDARDVAAGPVYTGRLRHHLPLTFHGSFTPRVARPAGAAP